MVTRNSVYFLGLAITYLLAFVSAPLVAPFALVMIVWSYVLIITTRSVLPVVALVIYARSIVGFIASGNTSFYIAFDVIVNYLPAVVFYVATLGERSPRLLADRYLFSLIYAAILIVYSLISGESALPLLGDRILPFFMFLFLVGRDSQGQLASGYRDLMRFVIPVTIIAALMPSYLSAGADLLQNGTIFGSESTASLSLGALPRATGPVWDPRILGVLCFLNLYAALSMKGSKLQGIDISLSLIGVVISLSRGSIVSAGILITFFMLRKKDTTGIVLVMAALVGVILSWQFLLAPIVSKVFVVGGVNPLEQRSEFFMYAFDQFLKHPLGIGVGRLRDISRALSVYNGQFDSITDAYIAILLAEVGIFGFAAFVLSFREIFWGANVLSPAVFGAFFVQMIGTDIPDFGPPYLAILIVGGVITTLNSPPDRGMTASRQRSIALARSERG